MQLIIGTDEAGYGPRLGPLVISATAWQAQDDVQAEDLYDHIGEILIREPKGRGDEDGQRVVWADSKMVYKPHHGLARLERGLFAALHLLEDFPREWLSFWEWIAPGSAQRMAQEPWFADYGACLPIEEDPLGIDKAVLAIQDRMEAVGVRLLAVRSRPIFTDEYNQLTDQLPTKEAVLSRETLGLVRQLLTEFPTSTANVFCDRFGSRKGYAPLLQEHVADQHPVEVRREAKACSRYAWGPPDQRVQVSFHTRGESLLPVALASMASKYLRELAMRALNDFWCRRVPRLRPTAGYPADATRFGAQIRRVQMSLGISDHVLWRNK